MDASECCAHQAGIDVFHYPTGVALLFCAMPQFNWRPFVSRVHLGFGLGLILVSLAFFVGTSLIAKQVMSYTYETSTQLQSGEQPEIQLSLNVTVVAIEAAIDRREVVTEVTVTTGNSILRELELDFPVTEFDQIEDALMQELGLSREVIKRLTRYRLD